MRKLRHRRVTEAKRLKGTPAQDLGEGLLKERAMEAVIGLEVDPTVCGRLGDPTAKGARSPAHQPVQPQEFLSS